MGDVPVNLLNANESSELVQRATWSLVWLAITTFGLDIWSQWSSWPGDALLAPGLVGAGILGLGWLWLRQERSSLAGHFAMATSVLAVLAGQGANIAARNFYTTDSAAFNDVATRLFLHGHNPYSSSMAPADALLRPAANFWTYLLGGGHVTQVSYPAGSFIFQGALHSLGVHHLTTDWLDLGSWIIAAVALYAFLDKPLRWIAPLLLLANAYMWTFANGGTDALWVPFLVVAVWRWDRFAAFNSSGIERWISPVALGVACSIKQSPWFCLPFLLLGVALEARAHQTGGLRTPLRYGLLTLGTFGLVNSPFIIWDPRAWLDGVLLPLRRPLVPDGQGLIALALHGFVRGVDLRLLWVAGVVALGALLLAMILWYPTMKRAWLFLLPLVLFIPGRSISNYLLNFFPAAILAGLSVTSVGIQARVTMPAWVRRLLGTAPWIATVLLATLALSRAPLSITVGPVQTSNNYHVFTSIQLTVHNNTRQNATPHFMVALGGSHPSGFWDATLSQGVFPLAPGASATVTITPTRWTWAPNRADYWLVDAFTSTPQTLSTSQLQRWPLGPLQ